MVGLALLLLGGLGAGKAGALDLGGPTHGEAEGRAADGARARIAAEVNARLLAEGRKNPSCPEIGSSTDQAAFR